MTRYTKKNDKNYGCKMNGYMWADKSYEVFDYLEDDKEFLDEMSELHRED